MSTWDYISRKIETCDRKTAEKIACPECGGSILLSFGKIPITRKKQQDSCFLSAMCKRCITGITVDLEIGEPPWAKTCNGRLETNPVVARHL